MSTPFTVSATAPTLPASVALTPQQLINYAFTNATFEISPGYSVLSTGTRPTSDQGPYKPSNGREWENWDSTDARYYPDGQEPGAITLFCAPPPSTQSAWLLADGSVKSQVTYSRLFRTIGHKFAIGGVGSADAIALQAATQFRLPSISATPPLCARADGNGTSAEQTITNGTRGKFDLVTVRYDDGSLIRTVDDVVVAPAAGRMRIQWHVNVTVASGGTFHLELIKNGTPTSDRPITFVDTPAPGTYVLETIEDVVAGDVFEPYVFNNTGSDLKVSKSKEKSFVFADFTGAATNAQAAFYVHV